MRQPRMVTDKRFIAIYDQMDTETNPNDDIIPFKNILNEMYAKDCSRKSKAVVKAKGNSGKHISYLPPLGYMKSPNDKEKWIIEPVGAAIVKKYSDFEELTPELLRAFVDKIIIHEKTKINGHYAHTIKIIYNFVETIELLSFDSLDKY